MSSSVRTYLSPGEGEVVRGVIIDIDAADLLIPFLAAPIGSGLVIFTNRYVFTKKRFYGAFGEESTVMSINWVVLWIIITAVAVLESVLSFVLARRNNAKL